MGTRRPWPERGPHGPLGSERRPALHAELRQLAHDIDADLREIDFAEVTTEDRIAFLEAGFAWQVRRALWAGRFDLAIEVQRFGAERIARLFAERNGWWPVLLYGVPPRPSRRRPSITSQ
jgi:hypothetical protein